MQLRVVPCFTKHERETSEREGEAPSCPIGGMPPNEQQHPLHSQWICTMFLGSPSQLRAEGHTWPAHLCHLAHPGLGQPLLSPRYPSAWVPIPQGTSLCWPAGEEPWGRVHTQAHTSGTGICSHSHRRGPAPSPGSALAAGPRGGPGGGGRGPPAILPSGIQLRRSGLAEGMGRVSLRAGTRPGEQTLGSSTARAWGPSPRSGAPAAHLTRT